MIVCLGEINKRRKNHEQNYTKSSYRDSIMSIIDIKLSGRLEDMIKEVEKEYNLSAGEIIANSLDHFIKDKKDFLVGHRFELEQVVKQKQLEFAQATKALKFQEQCKEDGTFVGYADLNLFPPVAVEKWIELQGDAKLPTTELH